MKKLPAEILFGTENPSKLLEKYLYKKNYLPETEKRHFGYLEQKFFCIGKLVVETVVK